MSSLVNLCIIQPVGHLPALRLLDPARHLRDELSRLGLQVRISKNRLLHDAVNLILGAEAGFDADLRRDYACVIVNLEQLDDPARAVDQWYLALLADSPVVDYDPANVRAYRATGEGVRLVRFGSAGGSSPAELRGVRERSREVLVVGDGPLTAMTVRVAEAVGLEPIHFEVPRFGPERDELLTRVRAVILTNPTPHAHLDHALVSRAMSLGTPVVAQTAGSGFVDPAIAECVMWFEGSTLTTVMAHVGADAFIDWAEQALERFAMVTPVEDIAAVADLIGHVAAARPAPQRRVVRRVHIGSGREYKPGWFNVDIIAATRPDAVLDLSQPLTWPIDVDSATTGPVTLEAGQVELIYANNVLEHVGDLPTLMSNCLDLLALDGELVVAVPYEHSDSAWQDPTHVRAMNERSWLYYTAWFWYLGWIEHRFYLKSFDYLDDDHNVVTKEVASQMRVEFVKVQTTAAERMLARSMRADFGMPELVA